MPPNDVPADFSADDPADDPVKMVEHLRRQVEHCAALGSPLYSSLLTSIADDAAAGGPAREVLRGHESDPGPSALGLRLMGAVHRLVLDRRAPELALTYPSVGGTGDAAWPALRALLVDEREAIRALLHQAPQTNEVGRASALVGGLLHLAAGEVAAYGGALPIRLVEIGASAGLNLRADHFRVESESGSVGPVGSPVVLADAWRGAPLPTYELPPVVSRVGCDLAPIDPSTTEGRLSLTAFVWADQRERLERLRGALEVAQQVPASVVASGAADFLDTIELVEGSTTVVWHSIMWQYVDPAEQVHITARLAELGERATATARLARLQMEPVWSPNGDFEVVVELTTWPSGGNRRLVVSAAHGLPTIWD